MNESVDCSDLFIKITKLFYENEIIGYFVKEGNRVLEYELDPAAYKYLSADQVDKIEKGIKKLKW